MSYGFGTGVYESDYFDNEDEPMNETESDNTLKLIGIIGDLPDGYSVMIYDGNAGSNAIGLKTDDLKFLTEHTVDLRRLLRKTIKQYDKSDNGKCEVCRIGHRLHDLKGNIGICEWQECLSHEWREALQENK